MFDFNFVFICKYFEYKKNATKAGKKYSSLKGYCDAFGYVIKYCSITYFACFYLNFLCFPSLEIWQLCLNAKNIYLKDCWSQQNLTCLWRKYILFMLYLFSPKSFDLVGPTRSKSFLYIEKSYDKLFIIVLLVCLFVCVYIKILLSCDLQFGEDLSIQLLVLL